MGRLIDPDALIESLSVDPIGCCGCPEPEWLEELAMILDTAEEVDAVKVVRCIECKYYEGLAECSLIGDCMGTLGFCAWGERKE